MSRPKLTAFSQLLSRIAGSAWGVACTSFVLTALVIRSNSLSLF